MDRTAIIEQLLSRKNDLHKLLNKDQDSQKENLNNNQLKKLSLIK